MINSFSKDKAHKKYNYICIYIYKKFPLVRTIVKLNAFTFEKYIVPLIIKEIANKPSTAIQVVI